MPPLCSSGGVDFRGGGGNRYRSLLGPHCSPQGPTLTLFHPFNASSPHHKSRNSHHRRARALDLPELHRELGSTGGGNGLHEGVEKVIRRDDTRSVDIGHAGNHHTGNGGLDLGQQLRTWH